MEDKYRILSSEEALSLKQDPGTEPRNGIEWNRANVYTLSDDSYLVMGLIGSFCPAVWVKDYATIEQFIVDEFFPDGDKLWLYYKENRHFYDDLNHTKSQLIRELFVYCKLEETTPVNVETVDYIWAIIKKRRKKAQYRLHFSVLVCEYFIQLDSDCYIDVRKECQTLNPTMMVVLRSKNDLKKYIDIDHEVFGKWGFFGMRMTAINAVSRMKIANIERPIITGL